MTMLERALRWVVLAGIFALPFIVFYVSQNLFFPFITGKNFAFRYIVEIMAGAWLALAFVDANYRPRRSWLLAAFAAFVVIIAIADAQGAYPFKSFWSNYERMDGWVTLAHLFAYFVVAISVLNTEKLWKRFWQTSIAVSVLVGVYGLLQLAGAATLGQGGAAGLGARLDATFGNPIYLAAYMLFNIFLAGLLWARDWQESAPGKRLTFSLLYGGATLLDTVILFFTGTRGTILGLVGGLLIAVALFVLSSRDSRNAWRGVGAAVAVIAVFSGGLWLLRDSAFVHRVGFLDRLASISLSDPTVAARFMNWGMAWQGVKERPLLGWGQENYAIVFDKYYNPRMYTQEQWFDRVHDVIFDWLVAGGFLGLLGYLSLYACALWCMWRKSAPSNTYVFSSAERSILTGLLAAYFFHDLFVFDNITSYILFASVLAYITWRASASSPAIISGRIVPRNFLPIVAAVSALCVWGAAWWINAKPLAANEVLLKALSQQPEGVTKNLDYFKEAISYGSYGTQEAREQLAQAAAQVAGASNIPDTVKKDFLQTAAQEMYLQAQASPLDARFPLFLGVVLDSFGDYTDGAVALQKAHEVSPTKQTILYELASNQFARGDTAGGLASFKAAFELLPENNDARIYYAAAAIRVKQDALADELLAPIMASGVAGDARIASAYVSRGLYDKIVTTWEAHVKAQPNDGQGYFTLAAAYYQTGNTARAIATLQALESAVPSAKDQAAGLIQQIQSGTLKLQ